jgi:uncharacterized protein YidB (DUF937 family)
MSSRPGERPGVEGEAGTMANMFGGSGGLGALESILGGSKGGIGALLPSVLGMLGGGGLNDLLKTFGANGLGDIIGSWVGPGPNKKITPAKVKKGLGKDKMKHLAQQSGLPENEVAKHLSEILPNLVNTLTPARQVPDAAGLQKGLAGLQGMLK